MLTIRGTTYVVAIAVGVAVAAPPIRAQAQQNFPTKPVRFIVGLAPGGAQDATARAIAQKLSETWGRQVIVDNRPGATGAIALDLTTKAAPDGHTSSLFYVLVHSPSVPVKSIKELIAYAKANPGKLSYGVPGTGSLLHFAVEMFSHMTGTKLVHVPYKGGAPAITALLAGEVQLGMVSLIALRPHMQSGRLRPLAITAKQRSPSVPELPTIAEAGVPGYEVDPWYGVVTSAKVSSAIIRKLNAGITEALKSPDVAQRLAADGSTPVGSSPEEFGALIKSEIAKWRKLVKDAGLVLN
ncbi:MAG: tripartite tricarboxylate transporter substrate binding protein [Betaproteobacteria bacterium]|nr:tripartite tricarboxylate transporter substrate binding protein [Betaproteobacteria bacterium]